MKIVAITACATGLAHTYIAEERLKSAAKELGHFISVETQGSMGVENRLKAEEIEAADVVILAADINVTGKDRFKGKKVVEIGTKMVVKSAKKLISQIEEKLK